MSGEEQQAQASHYKTVEQMAHEDSSFLRRICEFPDKMGSSDLEQKPTFSTVFSGSVFSYP